MKLKIIREPNPLFTLGKLFIDGVYFGETLEDVDCQIEKCGAAAKIPGDTAIPRGEYALTIDYSNRFKCQMLHILEVPCFDGIRIHSGNTTDDVRGCVMVGSGRADGGYLLNSRATVKRLLELVNSALMENEEVTIEIT